jgi:hypothetical protein
LSNALLFYKNIVPVDRTQHKNWSLNPIANASFTKQAHAVLLLGTEFVEAAREYPIVFVRNAEYVTPVALLGLREGENLFVDAEGKWQARYIPSYVRRYPFVFAETADKQLLLSLDSEFAGLDQTGKTGQRLFDANGQETEFLKHTLGFVQAFQADFMRTHELCTELDKLGLFKDMNIQATLNTGERYNMNGFYVVDEQKLLALPEAEITRLFKSGILGAVYAHLMSLGNAAQLVNRLAESSTVSA